MSIKGQSKNFCEYVTKISPVFRKVCPKLMKVKSHGCTHFLELLTNMEVKAMINEKEKARSWNYCLIVIASHIRKKCTCDISTT